MTPTTTRPTNWTYLAVAGIVRLYMIGTLAVSFGHIITAAHLLQLDGWQALTVPFAVDGFAVLGMIGRSRRFAASTQRTGLRLQLVAGAASLACNIYAGHTIGQRIYGALIVIAFVVAEWYAGKLRPAATPAPAPTPEQLAHAKRSAAATKAAATRRAHKDDAERKAAARRERAAARRNARQIEKEMALLAAGDYPTDAPVSPAPTGEI